MNPETLDLSEQQTAICRLALEKHLNATEIAKRLNTSAETVRIQIGRIWAKAEKRNLDSINNSVNSTPPGVNHCHDQADSVDPDLNLDVFGTQVQRILYLRKQGYGNRQIAEILGITSANVRTVLSRLRKQRMVRTFAAPIPVGGGNRVGGAAERESELDGARMFYHKFVTETNTAPTKDVLRGLHLTGQGGKQAAQLVSADRAVIVKVLAELSRCGKNRTEVVHINVDDPGVRRICGPILREHFTEICPGYYKPKDKHSLALLMDTLGEDLQAGPCLEVTS